MSKMQNWKIIGLGIIMLVLASVALIMKATAQSESAQGPLPSIVEQAEEEMELDSHETEIWAETVSTSVYPEFAFALNGEYLGQKVNAAQREIAQQNWLLLVINSAALSKEQLTKFKSITAELLRSREHHRAELEKHQKEVNAFLLKFQGTTEELKKGLNSLIMARRLLSRAHLESIAGVERTLKESLSFEQGSKMMLALRKSLAPMMREDQRTGRMMLRHRMNERMQDTIVPKLPESQDLRRPMMRLRPQQQMLAEQMPQISVLGRFLMRHLDAWDAALTAKLAALGG